MRGQYTAGVVDGEAVVGYREEEGVDPDSRTETYVALRLRVDNWRWAGVPDLRPHRQAAPGPGDRGGPAVPQRPLLAFEGELARQLRPNTLVLRIQPDEGISLHFGAKVPGEAFRVQSVAMDFSLRRGLRRGDRRPTATRGCSTTP